MMGATRDGRILVDLAICFVYSARAWRVLVRRSLSRVPHLFASHAKLVSGTNALGMLGRHTSSKTSSNARGDSATHIHAQVKSWDDLQLFCVSETAVPS